MISLWCNTSWMNCCIWDSPVPKQLMQCKKVFYLVCCYLADCFIGHGCQYIRYSFIILATKPKLWCKSSYELCDYCMLTALCPHLSVLEHSFVVIPSSQLCKSVRFELKLIFVKKNQIALCVVFLWVSVLTAECYSLVSLLNSLSQT